MDHASNLDPAALLRHEDFVLRLARTLVRGESDAREVAQRTLVSAIENPPQHSGVRAWLARVTRNHAHDLHRGSKRRAARERAAARPEAVAPETTAVERLELESDVVRAVLALDDPYRSVIVATYYEELAPSEIAKQRGVPAGTVRSQLTRAHELLRAKLDSRHGERASWMHGLTGLIALSDAPHAAPSIGMPLAIGVGLAACVVSALVVRAMLTPASTLDTSAVESPGVPMKSVETALGASKPAPTRSVIETTAIVSTVALASFAPADEPVRLLEQSRQIKKLILDRRLAVTAEERARAGIPVDTATSGVVRLLERNVFGDRFTLPWMRLGGSYYSFTERVHDYNRRPQIQLQDAAFTSSSAGGCTSMVLDLGVRSLADVPASHVAPAWLAPELRFLWDVAHAELDPKRTSLDLIYAQRRNDAVERAEMDGAAAEKLDTFPRLGALVRLGHSYLVRSVSTDEHDVIAVVEVIDASAEQCTIAYRIHESRSITSPRDLRAPEMLPDALPPPAEELARMSEPELLAALDAVRTRANEVLFEHLAPGVESRFGALRDRPDAGLVRLTPYITEWAELSTHFTGGAEYAFLARSHDGGGDVSLQGLGNDATLGDGLTGGAFGVFVDLGTTPIESVSVGTVAAQGELGTYLADHVFPHATTDLPASDPAGRPVYRAASDDERAAGSAFRTRTLALGGHQRAPATVGRTYAIRSVQFGSSDLLAVVHVAAQDEQGVVIAWKLLKSWPVLQRD